MTIDCFIPTFNEEFMLPKAINWYRAQCPHIQIYIADNGSTDNTVQIAKEMGCHILPGFSIGEIRDDLLTHWKNTVWKSSKANLVVVADCDEFCALDQIQHIPIIASRPMYFKCEGYNMISETRGARETIEDKTCIFSPKIKQIAYGPGAHHCVPIGGFPSMLRPRLYHMKWAFGWERVWEVHKQNAARLSAINKKNGWGHHYEFTEDNIKGIYNQYLQHAI